MNDHLQAGIFWYDPLNQCETLKKAFTNAFKTAWNQSTCLDNTNDSRKNSYLYKSSAIEMFTFIAEETCVQYIQKNNNKRIFLIISDTISEHFLSRVAETCPTAFLKCANNQSSVVYVLRTDVSKAKDWTIDYTKDVQIFDHEINLLGQLVRDIGHYFVTLGQESYGYKSLTFVRQSLKYFYLAQALFLQANEIEKTMTSDERERNVITEIAVAETLLQQLTNEDNVDIDQCIRYGEVTDENDTAMLELCDVNKLNSLSPSFQIRTIIVENSYLPTEPDSVNLSDDIKEKLPSQIENLVNDLQNSPEIVVCLLLPSPITKDFESICSILEELYDQKLLVVSSPHKKFEISDAKNLFAIILPTPTDGYGLILEKICALDSPPSVYVFEPLPNTTSDKEVFLTKHSAVCAMLNDPQDLVAKVTLDIALKSRIMGDRYAQSKDKERANKMYDQCVILLNRLNLLVLKNTDNTV